MNLFQQRLKPYPTFGEGTCIRRVVKASKELGHRDIPGKRVCVVGSDGKGSHVSALEGICIEQCKQVFTFTSPHFIKFEERFRYNGEPLSIEFLLECLNEVEESIGNQAYHYGKFEILYLCAVVASRKLMPEISIIEAGIGGKKDPSRCFLPHLSILTSVSLDHTNLLGTTIPEIAQDKLSVAPPFGCILMHKNVYDKVRKYPEALSHRNGKVLITEDANNIFTGSFSPNYFSKIALSNAYRAFNELFDTNLSMTENSFNSMRKPEGRYQWVKENCLIDGAHTEDAFGRLFESLLLDEKVMASKRLVFILFFRKARAENLCYVSDRLGLIKESPQLRVICSSYDELESLSPHKVQEYIQKMHPKSNVCIQGMDTVCEHIKKNRDTTYISIGSMHANSQLVASLTNRELDVQGLR